MSVNGFACWLEFKDVESESRFKRWILDGNARTSAMGVAALGLEASTIKVDGKFLFLWRHDFIFSMGLLLRLLLWLQLRRVRKSVTMRMVTKLELVKLVVDEGVVLRG